MLAARGARTLFAEILGASEPVSEPAGPDTVAAYPYAACRSSGASSRGAAK
jgi:hypothetical protein